MDFLSALKIAGTGLSAQRTRVNVAATNLANAESTRGPGGQPYHRRDPVLTAVPFEASLAEANGVPLAPGEPGAVSTAAAVTVTEIRKIHLRANASTCPATPTPIRTASSPSPTSTR